MKHELKENAGLPAYMLWTFAIVAGVSVANLYYNQPLLNLIRQDLQVSEFQTNLIAMITQVGYALGLLFIVPLGDLYRRKRIVLFNFLLLVVSLLSMAVATHIYQVLGRFAGDRHLFHDSADFCAYCIAILASGTQRPECGDCYFRAADGYSGIAGSKRLGR